ncbi:MAG TPA: hypothetical protein VIQ24_14490 [Pyrinomonadaceae bacterium]
MSPERQRTSPHDERPAKAAAALRHSAFEEFRRDERRPAVLLFAALVIAAIFFALGIMLGRWVADDTDASGRRPQSVSNQPSATPPAPSEQP